MSFNEKEYSKQWFGYFWVPAWFACTHPSADMQRVFAFANRKTSKRWKQQKWKTIKQKVKQKIIKTKPP